MKKQNSYIGIRIDKLTNSIENVKSGDSFPTDVILFNNSDLKSISKKDEWLFDWKSEFNLPDRDVYKLTISNNPLIIQGLISLTVMPDHVYIHLVESSHFNKGRNKVYKGVPGNLFAFACKLSFHRGFEGYTSFVAKTKLIKHYEETLGAVHFKNNLMIIYPDVALKLIGKYF